MSVKIKAWYEKGGYKLIAKKTEGQRMRDFQLLPPEEQIIWTRFLHWRWLKKNPEFVKRANSKWWNIYKQTKPCICVCMNCGKKFNAPRSHYKMCDDCHKLPTKQRIAELKAEARQEVRLLAKDMYFNQGLTQMVIADKLGAAQKTISNWVRNKTKKLQNT